MNTAVVLLILGLVALKVGFILGGLWLFGRIFR